MTDFGDHGKYSRLVGLEDEGHVLHVGPNSVDCDTCPEFYTARRAERPSPAEVITLLADHVGYQGSPETLKAARAIAALSSDAREGVLLLCEQVAA